MPPAGSPPRGSESEKLQAKPAATFGTFETRKPGRDGGSGASTSSGEANDDGVFDTDFAPVDANPDAELEVEIVRPRRARACATRGATCLTPPARPFAELAGAWALHCCAAQGAPPAAPAEAPPRRSNAAVTLRPRRAPR